MLKYGKPIIVIYAVLMLGGGIGGYASAHSKYSLVSGIVSAILLGIGYSMLSSKPKAGYAVCLVVAALLVAVFVVRTIQTASVHSSMTRNIGLAVLSLAVAAVMAVCMNESE